MLLSPGLPDSCQHIPIFEDTSILSKNPGDLQQHQIPVTFYPQPIPKPLPLVKPIYLEHMPVPRQTSYPQREDGDGNCSIILKEYTYEGN